MILVLSGSHFPLATGGFRFSLPAPPPPKRSTPMARAEYDFAAQDGTQINLQEGVFYELVQKEADWWLVKNNAGTEGWAPANYMSERE